MLKTIGYKSKRPMLTTLLVTAVFMLESCFNIGNRVHATFDSLKPGMSLTEVSEAIGSPDALVGEITTVYGQRVVVWKYEKLTQTIPTEHAAYWIYLADGKYHKHTLAGDWQKESKLIYKTDFSSSQQE